MSPGPVHPVGGILAGAVIARVPAGAAVAAFKSLSPLRPITAIRALAAVPAARSSAFVFLTSIDRLAVIAVHHLLVAIVIIGIVTALAALILEAGAAFAQHAEIMVRELQIIFGLDAVSGELRVAGHALVFLEELSGVATLAIVLSIAFGPSTDARRPLPPATATAATLTIVDQMPTSLIVVEAAPRPQAQAGRLPEESRP
jgi:hypothetical protein